MNILAILGKPRTNLVDSCVLGFTLGAIFTGDYWMVPLIFVAGLFPSLYCEGIYRKSIAEQAQK